MKNMSLSIFVCVAFILLSGYDASLPDVEHCSSDDYSNYLKEFGLSMKRLVDGERFLQFCTSQQFIAEHNTKANNKINGLSFTLRLTDRSDMFESELSSLFSSVVADPMSTDQHTHIQREVSATSLIGTDITTHLNWATSDNPHGYSIIPPVQDQGICGACWAFASIASVAASLKLSLDPSIVSESTDPELISSITPGNDPPIINIPVLSAQQLIDCDRTFNTGCNGGSPYYALQYIAINGLVSALDYRFIGKQYTCHAAPSLDNRYFIRHYNLLTANNENVILRNLNAGPVIVGLCGTDLTFLYYASGIYNLVDCCTTQNHAMLLVGYGRDEESGLDYWVAQNSWGQNWGERGYMRILRQTGTTSAFSGGICGLAFGPVVSSDGFIVGNDTLIGNDGGGDSLLNRFLDGPVVWMETNWQSIAFILGIICITLGVVFLLGGIYFDYLMRGHAERRARSRGYVTLVSQVYGKGSQNVGDSQSGGGRNSEERMFEMVNSSSSDGYQKVNYDSV